MAEAKERPGSRERAKLGGPVDAVIEGAGAIGDGADRVARWTPQQTVQVCCVVLLGFICVGFAAMLWISQEQNKAQIREFRDQNAGQMREANAREELRAVHCAAEAEKVRRESAETVKAVLAAAALEGEKGRAFQAQQNEMFRREMAAAVRGKP